MAGSPHTPHAEAPPAVVDVLVVDDQEPYLSVARFVVGSTPGFRVTGEAKTGEDAVAQAAALRPGLVDLPQDARTSGARAYVHKEDLAPDVLAAVMTGELPAGF